MIQEHIEATKYITDRVENFPTIAILTGTGLGLSTELESATTRLPYRGIPYFPSASSRGHDGELIISHLGGQDVAVFSGRLHYYEGHDIQSCGFPIHLMATLGVKNLIMSNVSGSVNPKMTQGDLVLIKDHINLMGVNPLRGQRNQDGYISFPEMREAYAKMYHQPLIQFCKSTSLNLQEGVYAAFAGPSLETPQEYKMASILGADLVGMSTVPEVIVAAAYGIRTNVISLVSNECFGESPQPTSIETVLAVAEAKRSDVLKTIVQLIGHISSTT